MTLEMEIIHRQDPHPQDPEEAERKLEELHIKDEEAIPQDLQSIDPRGSEEENRRSGGDESQ